jgi:tetratricopeptide (TPR) repeat protein
LNVLLALALASSASGAVMVMPPEGPPTPEGAWVAQAVADGLPRALGLLAVPAVDRADRLRAQEALGIPPLTLSRATSIRVAEALGASRLVVGTCQLEGGVVRLALRLLDVERATLSAPLMASGPLDTLPALIQGLAWDIALSGPTRPSRTREEFLALRAGVPFEAFRSYAQGLAASDPALRLKRVKRALALAPGYDEARLTLGRLEIETRDDAAASETLARVAPTSPLARTAQFLRGAALLHLARYREAADLYQGLVGQEASAAALSNQGVALLRLGTASPRASVVFRQALEKGAAFPDLSFNLAWALLLEGEPAAAAFWLRGLTRREAGDAAAHLVLSWALRKADREAEAVEEWRIAAALSPSYEPLASPDPSRRFERILASERPLVPEGEGRSGAEMAATYAARGEKLAEAGEREGALAELTRAAYLDPYSARAHVLLARLSSESDPDKAAGELRMALWCRDDATVRLELAGLLMKLGRGAEARAEARRVLQALPDNAAARRLLETP